MFRLCCKCQLAFSWIQYNEQRRQNKHSRKRNCSSSLQFINIFPAIFPFHVFINLKNMLQLHFSLIFFGTSFSAYTEFFHSLNEIQSMSLRPLQRLSVCNLYFDLIYPFVGVFLNFSFFPFRWLFRCEFDCKWKTTRTKDERKNFRKVRREMEGSITSEIIRL